MGMSFKWYFIAERTLWIETGNILQQQQRSLVLTSQVVGYNINVVLELYLKSQYLHSTFSDWGPHTRRRPLPLKRSCSVYLFVSDQSWSVKTSKTERLLTRDGLRLKSLKLHPCFPHLHLSPAHRGCMERCKETKVRREEMRKDILREMRRCDLGGVTWGDVP